MTNYEYITHMSVDEMAKLIAEHGQFDVSPWISWFSNIYCKNCPDIICKYEDGTIEFPCSYCELNGNCKFFPNLDETPDNKMIIKMWLESEV